MPHASAPIQMISRWMACCVVACAFGGAVPAAAEALNEQQQAQILDEAQSSYDRAADLLAANPAQANEAFRQSAAKLQLLVDAGVVNGKLHFNLANAYLQCNELGKAIVNYRRALAFRPGDERIEANLRQARSLVRTQIAPSGGTALMRKLLFFHYDTPLRWKVRLALSAYVLFWIALIGRMYVPRPGWWYLIGISAATWIALGSSAIVETASGPLDRAGVLMTDDVIVRKGNGEGFEPQFAQPLHQGVEFEMLERRGEWMQIKLPDDRSGWVKTQQVEMVGEAKSDKRMSDAND